MADEKRAALKPSQRRRLRHLGPTVPIEIDVARAFGDELPTAPGSPSSEVLAILGVTDDGPRTAASVPLDALPALVVAAENVPWSELGALETEVLQRVDGSQSAMAIVTGLGAAPADGARALAALVCRGLVRLG
jgi:hypothetical protein